VSGEVHLLKGSDPVLLNDAVLELLDRLVGESVRDEVLSEFDGDEYDLNSVVLAVSTVSMFGDRVVVARNLGRFGSDEWAPLLEYLEDPAPDADLVLVWEKAVAPGSKLDRVPKKLSDAVKACGGTVSDHGLPSGKGQKMWFADHVDAASVQLTTSARELLANRLGEDLSRLGGILDVLEATFGPGAGPLGPDEIEPFIGDAGGVPPWDLTDALDAGRVADAVTNLRRMVQGGDRHPLQIMATLHTHYGRMLRLDGSGVRSEKDAAALLGMKGSTYPAKKALAAADKLGSARIARAMRLLAVADLDLRGRTATSAAEPVIEVLVARLATLAVSRRR